MATLHISEELARKLHEISARENRPVEEVLESFVEKHESAPQPGTLAMLAKVAREANISSEHTDIGERSREILNTEFADYLLSRLN